MARDLTPSELTVLQLLHEGPTHPYDMQRLVRERRIDVLVPVRRGTLYHAVGRLERRGLIETVETTREGRRPERTVYRVTEAGEDALLDRLRELLAAPRRDYPELTQALSFISRLEPADARAQLELRVGSLEAEVAGFTALLAGARHLPREWVVEVEYVLCLRRAELEWLRGIVADLRAGRLSWSPHHAPSPAEPPALRLVDTLETP
jgi:DNA-binding PadR family transcriptional regulator